MFSLEKLPWHSLDKTFLSHKIILSRHIWCWPHSQHGPASPRWYVTTRVADPVWYWPDPIPDPTSQDKSDTDPWFFYRPDPNLGQIPDPDPGFKPPVLKIFSSLFWWFLIRNCCLFAGLFAIWFDLFVICCYTKWYCIPSGCSYPLILALKSN